MQSAKRASRTSLNDPGVLRAAALRGIDDQRAAAQCHPRQPARQDPGARPGDRKRPQIDVAGLDTAVDEGRRHRQVDAGLADVIFRVGDELRPAFVEFLQTRSRTDRDAVAARFADRLDHELGQVVERIAQPLRLAADMGLDIGQDRVLGEVIADDARHVGIDRLVVGDTGADSVGERQVAGPIGPHQTRHAQHALGDERLGIEIIVVDPAIDHVDAGQAAGGPHVDPVVLDKKIRALHQRHAHLACQEYMLEIGRIVGAGGQQHDLRVGNSGGCDLLQCRDQLGTVIVDRAQADVVEEVREGAQHHVAVLHHDSGFRPIDNYGAKLIAALQEVAPAGISDPQVVLLTPGAYNSAYFEHVFLAREMGVPLVEGSDLLVEDDRVYMRTTGGLARVDVIYRRINDDYLDPEAFIPESMLGVPGLMRAYRAGNLALANAVGTGVADDKAVYAYMPRIIRYYLAEDPILPNVETHICREPKGLRYTLDHLAELVGKPVGEAGGYGITVGPRASLQELDECRAKLVADPENYISQPCINLSVAPTLVDGRIEPRHVDLRPFAVTGSSTWVLPGGLTRVALRRGSLVVNSSQGGGSKDTWVLG